MAFADDHTYMGHGDGSIIGQFKEEQFGNFFEFSHNVDCIDHIKEDVSRFLAEGNGEWWNTFPHLVWVMNSANPLRKHDQGFRYARVMKTRAHVVVDEDENGPVIEVWKFRGAKAAIYDRLHYGEFKHEQA